MNLPSPYLLFLGDTADASDAKTAFGLRDWAPERVVAEWRAPGGKVTLGLPALSPAEARAKGARALVIGVAPVGGAIAPAWIPCLLEALEAGLDLVSGMHTPLADAPGLAAAAERLGRRLIDVRRPPATSPVATGLRRRGMRLLTVGADCALGKKYTALALARAFKARGVDADFRATGQTGIMIAGGGVPIDAVVADFVAGAAEQLSPDAEHDHWDVIEGQGSLFHPAYAGVSLGLLHGSQPDVVVVCHEAGRMRMSGYPAFRTPTAEEVAELTLRLARRTNPAVRCGGLSLNTSKLSEPEARELLAERSAQTGLPCADPIRGGPEFERLVDACLDR
ncbi:DUF1611 domain-containing protein [Phenylobacterium sp.]|uniref:DUF1611 domain-containing protein n=1 Tax=Phenylobacterium sp. TaxID=1871053 RepID=UPI002FC5F930